MHLYFVPGVSWIIFTCSKNDFLEVLLRIFIFGMVCVKKNVDVSC